MIDHHARAEDVRWMAETGECLTGAAQRLGTTVGALEKWCQLHNMHAALASLRARDQRMPVDVREINRRNAERRWAS